MSVSEHAFRLSQLTHKIWHHQLALPCLTVRTWKTKHWPSHYINISIQPVSSHLTRSEYRHRVTPHGTFHNKLHTITILWSIVFSGKMQKCIYYQLNRQLDAIGCNYYCWNSRTTRRHAGLVVPLVRMRKMQWRVLDGSRKVDDSNDVLDILAVLAIVDGGNNNKFFTLWSFIQVFNAGSRFISDDGFWM